MTKQVYLAIAVTIVISIVIAVVICKKQVAKAKATTPAAE